MQDKTKIILIGAGGHARSCIEVIESAGKYKIAGLIDRPERVGQKVLGHAIIGTDLQIDDYLKITSNFHVAFAGLNSHHIRKKIVDDLTRKGATFPSIIASSAYVSQHAKIEDGVFIGHRVIVNANAHIGKYVILNTGAIIEHDVKVGDYSHIAPGAVLNGEVSISSQCFIGSNSVLKQLVKVGDESVIGAGCYLDRDVSQKTMIKNNTSHYTITKL